MANLCQLCPGDPHIEVEDWRSLWLGMPDGFYLEWGRCCNDKKFVDMGMEPIELTNGKTGEKVVLETPQQLWTLIAGEENKDKFGEAIWY